MKNWLAFLIGATLIVAGCATVPTDTAEFGERFANMQIQSGAKFPTAPLYKSTRKIAQSGQ
jgi:hypothetical protein